MNAVIVTVDENGTVRLPAEMCRAAGIDAGTPVTFEYGEGEIRIRRAEDALAIAQATVARYFPGDERLSDRLIEERRREVARG